MSNSLNRTALRLSFALALFAAFLLVAPVTNAQETAPGQTAQMGIATTKVNAPGSRNVTPVMAPVFTDYRGINIGMSADEVRDKLDHLKEKGKLQDFFVFSDAESAQVYYDKQGKVKAISINYVGEKSNAPSPQAVLGEELQAKANGSIYQLKRYPAAGYWVAYSRTAGKNPLTTVTMQKMRTQTTQ